MCFSATASFSAGALLLGLGSLTLKSARHPRELPFAAIPPLFAIQQLSEGVLVVSLGYGAGLPLLQLYLAQYLGSAEPGRVAWHVGMLGGMYTLALFVFAPWWGRLSDRRGRTVVLMAGFSAFLVGSAAAALGALLGKQAAAGNLGQALGSFSAGLLFALHPAAPFWMAAIVLLFGAGAAYALWGAARDDEILAHNQRLAFAARRSGLSRSHANLVSISHHHARK